MILKHGSYAFKSNIINKHPLGGNPGIDPQGTTLDMVSEPSTSASQDVVDALVWIVSLFLFAIDASPFEGLLDRNIELVGTPLRFYKPAYAQHIISSLMYIFEDTHASIE